MILAQTPQARPVSPAYRRYVLASLGTVAFFNFLDRSAFSVLSVPIKQDLGLSDTLIGLLGGLGFALFYAVLGLPLARIADRRNRVGLVSACLAVWSLATAACGLATGFLGLALARIGVGAGEAGCFPPSYSILSDYYPARMRAFAIGMFHAGGNFGFLIGLMGSGLLASFVGWRMTFVLLGLPGFAFALLFVATVREPPRGGAARSRDTAPAWSEVLARLRRRSSFVHLTAAYTLGVFAFYGALAWLPHFFARSFGLTPAEIGLRYGLAFGGGMIVGVIVGALVAPVLVRKDSRWELWLPGLGALLAFPLFAGIHLASSVDAALMLTALGSAAVSMGLGPGFAAVQSLAEPDLRATAAALVLLVSALLGQGLGPLAVGVLSDILAARQEEGALSIALMLCATAFLWSAVHYLAGSRRFAEQADEAASRKD